MATRIRVAHASELLPGKGKVIQLGAATITVFNVEGRFHAEWSTPPWSGPDRGPPAVTSTACSLEGLAFDACAEDSPADYTAAPSCAVTLVDDEVWLETP